MEEKKVFQVGDRIEHMCATCKEERGHLVASVTTTGKIMRVSCPICGARVPYKAGSVRKSANTASAPYDPKRTYRKGQTLMHSTFGEGEVTAIIEPHKMDVLFSDRMRRLIHATE